MLIERSYISWVCCAWADTTCLYVQFLNLLKRSLDIDLSRSSNSSWIQVLFLFQGLSISNLCLLVDGDLEAFLDLSNRWLILVWEIEDLSTGGCPGSCLGCLLPASATIASALLRLALSELLSLSSLFYSKVLVTRYYLSSINSCLIGPWSYTQ